jgi:hypothetical protein
LSYRTLINPSRNIIHDAIKVVTLSDNRVEKSKVLMEDIEEKDLDFRLSKRSLEFFKIHM